MMGAYYPHNLCECLSCGENVEPNECPQSKRECGHHCNHTWSHDACDWCGATFEDGGVPFPESMKDVPILVKCVTCRGKGAVYADAPWARWMPCGACGGRGLV